MKSRVQDQTCYYSKSGDTELQNIVGKDKFQQYQGNLKDEEQKAKEKANSKIKSLKGDLNIK